MKKLIETIKDKIFAPPKAWTDSDREKWLNNVHKKGKVNTQPLNPADYEKDIVKRVFDLPLDLYDIETYGSLDVTIKNEKQSYDCLRVSSKNWDPSKPTIILTSGVHGYEREPIESNLQTLKSKHVYSENKLSNLLKTLSPLHKSERITDHFNVVSFICINPHGYEYGQRLGHEGYDVNRDNERSSARKMFEKNLTDFFQSKERDGYNTENIYALDLHTTPIKEDIKHRRQKAKMEGKRTPADLKEFANGAHIMTSLKSVKFAAAVIEALPQTTKVATNDKVSGFNNWGGIVASTTPGTVRSFLQQFAKHAITTEPILKNGGAYERKQAVKTLNAMTRGALKFALSQQRQPYCGR